jgi:ribosomal protein L40E
MGKALRQVTINRRSHSASCGHCIALMLPDATVCRNCAGFAVDHNRRPTTTSRRLRPADYSDGPTIDFAKPALPAPVPEPVMHRSDAPTLRAEVESVRSVGPNPFLPAARMLHAREEAQAS